MNNTIQPMFVVVLAIFGLVLNKGTCSTKNEDLMKYLKETGCPPRNINQFILNNVCLMPHYQSHEPPENANGKTLVGVDYFYHGAPIIELEEKRNRITAQIFEYIEWEDPRIKVNFSSMKNMLYSTNWIRFPPKIATKIWHPILDLGTMDMQEWKSLNDPLWFYSLGINKCPWMRDCSLSPNATKLYAQKHWRATLLCKFDFSSFPLDTQRCKFRQTFEASMGVVNLFMYSPFSSAYIVNVSRPVPDLKYIGNGFEITITPVGALVDSNTIMQNHTGDFGFDITLQRIIQPYVFQYYFPCAAIVIICHISFIIPLSAVPGRVALIVTQFLTLTNIFIHQMVRQVYIH